MADEQPGIWKSIVNAVKAPRGEDAEPAKAAAEEISKKLPKAVMPRAGIEEDRRRKAMIDALLKDQ